MSFQNYTNWQISWRQVQYCWVFLIIIIPLVYPVISDYLNILLTLFFMDCTDF